MSPPIASRRGGTGQLGRLEGKPVAQDLLVRVRCLAYSRECLRRDVRVLLKISDGLTRSPLHLRDDGGADLVFQARAIFEHGLDFISGASINSIQPDRGPIAAEFSSFNKCSIIRRIWLFSSRSCEIPKLSISSAGFSQSSCWLEPPRATERRPLACVFDQGRNPDCKAS